jgi:hypothetical protein
MSPLVAAVVLALVVVAGWIAGVHPFWPTPDMTVSEAAAIRDAGEVYRLVVYERQDPNRQWRVRGGMLTEWDTEMTPLEAGVRAGRPEIVRILLEHGTSVGDAAARAALVCRAVESGDPEVIDLLLATGDRTDPRSACADAASTR